MTSMDIFAASNGSETAGGGVELDELGMGTLGIEPVALPVSTPAPSAAPAPAPVRAAVDPHQNEVRAAVHYMRTEYWAAGKMHGALLEQWQGTYASLLWGCRTVAEVSRAAHLADYAMVVSLQRQNSKAPK